MKSLFLALILLPLMVFGQKNIILTDHNSIVLRGVVTWDSISRAQHQLLKLSANLRDDEIIYLVLDTPGGNVDAGEMFIETLASIKQPVHSVILFAASMGFQIAQVTKQRHITKNGILMSHRATLRIEGQLNGELESRLALYKKVVNKMETRSADRLDISLEEYQKNIMNEWWEQGADAIENKMADDLVTVSCDKRLLEKTVIERVRSLFGFVNVKFSRCPLITAPIHNFDNDVSDNEQLNKYFYLLFNDKRKFVESYISKGLF